MTTLKAHELLGRRDPKTGRAAFAYETTLPDGTDCWPAAATAACVLAGGVEEARDDSDLDELLGRFAVLQEIGSVTNDDLARAAMAVVEELLRWGAAVDRAAGGPANHLHPASIAAHAAYN